MDIDDRPRPLVDLASKLATESLDHLSRDDLDRRITLLEAEIVRTITHRQHVTAQQAAAEALFARPAAGAPFTGTDR